MSRSKQILKKHCPGMDEIFLDDERRAFRKRILDAMEDYAKEVAQASLEKASESAKTQERIDEKSGSYHWVTIVVDKESITSPENIILL